jgi:peptidase MA superfamily protein/tetratricopeptide repeat protein
LNAKDYAAAIRLLESASANDQFDEELKKLLGIAYTERGWTEAGGARLEDALSDFNKARLTEPVKQQATYLGLGYVSFRLKEYDDAAYYLGEAVYLDPDEPMAHELTGQLYYQRGKLDEAVSEWERALAKKPDDEELKKYIAKAKKELGVEGSFTKRETYYFNIKYEGEEKRELGDEVLDILNRASSDIGGDLGYYPREQVNVILYTRKQFVDVTDAPSWSGGIFDGNIRIPVGGRIDKTALSAVLHHEYTHAVIRMIVGGGRVPTWLDEGIAQYEERWARTPKADFGQAELMPLSTLNGSFMGIGDPDKVRLAYAESLSAVEYYVDHFGVYSLSKLLVGLGEGKDISGAMVQAAGITFERFDELWRGSLAR